MTSIRPTRSNRLHSAILAVALLCGSLTSFPAHAAGLEAKYLKATRGTVTLSITARGDSPQNIIIEQRVPPGTTILSTNPTARKIDTSAGSVKWLIKSIKGRKNISMTVKPTSSAERVIGFIRYRDQSTDTIIEKKVSR